MRWRTRILIAALFAALFALLPAPDAARGVPYLGYLRVREWLLDGDRSPFATQVRDGRLPPVAVTLRQSPPITDPAERARREADYARLAAEWLAAGSQAPAAPQAGPNLAALQLTVVVGTAGVQAELAGERGATPFVAAFPTRWSLLPAALAIVVAVLTQRVLLALLLAGLGGAIAWQATQLATAAGAPDGFLATTWAGADHYLRSALWERSICGDFYLRITAFVVCLFMTIGIVTANGGVHGFVHWLQRRVGTPARAQLATWLTGLAIFFDDYSNCLVTGTTMRPLCDRVHVSREKLAWLVDTTAAPVAGLSVFSTWIAYEVSQFRAPLALVTRADGTPFRADDAFAVFLDTLPFRFYCLFTLLLPALVILLRRDFGPMLAAERRARTLGKVLADDAHPLAPVAGSGEPLTAAAPRARNALLPLGVFVFGALGIMLAQGAFAGNWPADVHGFAASVRYLLGRAQPDLALLFASGSALLLAVLLTLGQRLLPLRTVAAVAANATRALVPAFGILFLAWSLGHIARDLGTSLFLTAGVGGELAPAALPLALFFTSALMAFATGTSFGTMAILLPNVVLLAHRLGSEGAFLGDPAHGGVTLMLLSLGAVLEGSIFGDHCSPISDTTVLSSMGSQCDHLAHVTTQLPYALLAMAVAAACGYLPMVLFGPGAWPWAFGGGVAAMAGWLWWFGRDPGAGVTSTA